MENLATRLDCLTEQQRTEMSNLANEMYNAPSLDIPQSLRRTFKNTVGKRWPKLLGGDRTDQIGLLQEDPKQKREDILMDFSHRFSEAFSMNRIFSLETGLDEHRPDLDLLEVLLADWIHHVQQSDNPQISDGGYIWTVVNNFNALYRKMDAAFQDTPGEDEVKEQAKLKIIVSFTQHWMPGLELRKRHQRLEANCKGDCYEEMEKDSPSIRSAWGADYGSNRSYVVERGPQRTRFPHYRNRYSNVTAA